MSVLSQECGERRAAGSLVVLCRDPALAALFIGRWVLSSDAPQQPEGSPPTDPGQGCNFTFEVWLRWAPTFIILGAKPWPLSLSIGRLKAKLMQHDCGAPSLLRALRVLQPLQVLVNTSADGIREERVEMPNKITQVQRDKVHATDRAAQGGYQLLLPRNAPSIKSTLLVPALRAQRTRGISRC